MPVAQVQTQCVRVVVSSSPSPFFFCWHCLTVVPHSLLFYFGDELSRKECLCGRAAGGTQSFRDQTYKVFQVVYIYIIHTSYPPPPPMRGRMYVADIRVAMLQGLRYVGQRPPMPEPKPSRGLLDPYSRPACPIPLVDVRIEGRGLEWHLAKALFRDIWHRSVSPRPATELPDFLSGEKPSEMKGCPRPKTQAFSLRST